MDKRRQAAHPRNPNSPSDFEDLIKNSADQEYRTNYQGMVKNAAGDAIGAIFGNPNLLMALLTVQMFAFDGTFHIAPTGWYQCFNIFFVIENHFFPAACILLTGKTTEIHDCVWKALKNLIPGLDLREGMADFE